MLSFEIVTPKQAELWCEQVDKRYESMKFFEGHRVEHMAEDLKNGWRPQITINTTTGELFDGAFAVRAIADHGKPVECAVARLPEDPKWKYPNTRGVFSKLPKLWQFLKMANEDRPPFAQEGFEG